MLPTLTPNWLLTFFSALLDDFITLVYQVIVWYVMHEHQCQFWIRQSVVFDSIRLSLDILHVDHLRKDLRSRAILLDLIRCGLRTHWHVRTFKLWRESSTFVWCLHGFGSSRLLPFSHFGGDGVSARVHGCTGRFASLKASQATSWWWEHLIWAAFWSNNHSQLALGFYLSSSHVCGWAVM